MSDKRFEFYSDDVVIGVLDTVTGRTFNSFEIVDCLNEQQVTITALKEENEKLIQKKCLPCELVNLQTREIDKLKKENEQLKKEYKIAIDEMVTDYKKLEKENEQLREKVKDYEVILSIANSNDVLCEYQEIDDIAYYCERYKDYRCYPLCRKDKSCFKKDKTFQGKLEDLKEFWRERWYE